MLQSSCSWSTNLTIWTIVFSVIILAAVGTILLTQQTNWFFFVVLVILVLPILLSPRKVQVTSETVTIKMVAFSYSIPVKNIETIEQYKFFHSVRVCGIGRLFGNIGWFTNKELGKHLAFVTNSSKSYVIYRKNQIPVVVTADDGSIFSQLMKQY